MTILIKSFIVFSFFLTTVYGQTYQIKVQPGFLDHDPSDDVIYTIGYAPNESVEIYPIYDYNFDLIFEDEFSAPSIDNYSYYSPNGAKWRDSYPWDHGDNINKWNASTNSYLPPRNIEYSSLSDNLVFTGSTLKLVARELNQELPVVGYYKDDTLLADGHPNKRLFKYSSGMLYSHRKFKHGKFELRCKVPLIDGVFPAFWLFGGNETISEIDIFEFNREKDTTPYEYNDDTYYDYIPAFASQRWWCTYHDWSYPVTNDRRAEVFAIRAKNFTFANEWHTYGLIWDEYKMIWTFDGVPVYGYYRYYTELPSKDDINFGIFDHASLSYHEQQGTTIYQNPAFPTDPMNLIINLAVKNFGGTYPDNTYSTGTFPVEMELDWVRVYADRTCGHSLTYCQLEDLPTTLAAENVTIGGNNCEQTVHENQAVNVTATNRVTLKSGFHAKPGSSFRAKIDNCSTTDLRTANFDTATSTIIILNEEGDTIKNTSALAIKEKDSIAEIEEKASNKRNTFDIYPNPNSGTFTLTLPDAAAQHEVVIYDLLGNVIYHSSIINNQRIDISTQPKGVYFVKVSSGNEVWVRKVVHQ